jgi:hypothetical protein
VAQAEAEETSFIAVPHQTPDHGRGVAGTLRARLLLGGDITMDAVTVFENVRQTAAQFAAERRERQQRRSLVAADFAQLKEAGFHLTGVPIDQGASGEACVRLPDRRPPASDRVMP